MAGIQQLLDTLYIGDAPAARQLDTGHGFDEVVTLGYFDRMGYTQPDASTTGDRFVFPDSPEHDYADFVAAVEYVIDALERDQQTLVHCQAGVSRSAGVSAVAIYSIADRSLDEALAFIESKRPIVNPAPSIRESMERYTGESLGYVPSGAKYE